MQLIRFVPALILVASVAAITTPNHKPREAPGSKVTQCIVGKLHSHCRADFFVDMGPG